MQPEPPNEQQTINDAGKMASSNAKERETGSGSRAAQHQPNTLKTSPSLSNHNNNRKYRSLLRLSLSVPRALALGRCSLLNYLFCVVRWLFLLIFISPFCVLVFFSNALHFCFISLDSVAFAIIALRTYNIFFSSSIKRLALCVDVANRRPTDEP